MTERDDLEQIISHLQILRTWCAVSPDYGMGLSADDCQKAVGWLDGALELLKERQPRLMSTEDFENNPDVDNDGFLPCWVECNEAERARGVEMGIIPPDGTLDGWTEISVHSMPGRMDYNPDVRYWTGKPSDEQRKAVKWE